LPTEKEKRDSGPRANTRGLAECFVCNKLVDNPKEENYLEQQVICDGCRAEMLDSLEKAWKKHSAFLDAALN
jgi:hypothetical protein